MGYRDGFYVVANIIGYTGIVHLNPTVYFQSGNEFGHITQSHDVKENTGREAVRSHANYRIRNRQVNGSLLCVESVGDRVFHTSRNTFVPVNGLSALQVGVLNRSVINFTEQKAINLLSPQEWRDLVQGPTIRGANVSDLINRHEMLIAMAGE